VSIGANRVDWPTAGPDGPPLRDRRGAPLSEFTADAVALLEGPEWLRAARAAAFERFEAATLPTDAEEVWRYSRVDQLDLDRYRPITASAEPDSTTTPESIAAILAAIGKTGGTVIVHNGRAVVTESAHAGLTLALAGDEPLPIGDIAGEPDALATLNAAFTAPVTVRVAEGAVVADPVVIVHWIDADGVAHFPRTLVQVGEGAEVTVVEVAASADVDSLTVPVTELDVGDAAHLRYLNLQTLGLSTWQIGLQSSRVGRDASLSSASVAFGGDYARVRTDSTLSGKGGSSRLLAVYFGEGHQMHDFRTLQAHEAPKTLSDLLFKGAVAGSSHSVYSGLIRVRKGAVGTNAFQTNRNLVLNEGAHADSVPNLEIEENDVRCSHASAVGPIDEEQRFYLESRGVPPAVADRLIVLGFLDDVLSQTPVPSLVPLLREALADKLDHAERTDGRGSR
jgi:Fe-S cluster assembly protein SufD